MRKIAIVKIHNSSCYECGAQDLMQHITDWGEVTDKEYELLRNYVKRKNYHIVELCNDKIPTLIQEAIKEAELELKRQEQSRKKYEQDKKDRELKAARKKLEKAKKILEEAGEL